MANLIAIVIFLGSLFGMGNIIYRKRLLLSELSVSQNDVGRNSVSEKFCNKTSSRISFYVLLQKLLCGLKVIIVRIEKKITFWIENLKKKSTKEKNNFSEDIWEKIKD